MAMHKSDMNSSINWCMERGHMNLFRLNLQSSLSFLQLCHLSHIKSRLKSKVKKTKVKETHLNLNLKLRGSPRPHERVSHTS